jgi:nucleoside-diphosphate-sugar epimerase
MGKMPMTPGCGRDARAPRITNKVQMQASEPETNSVFIVGCGDIGSRVARLEKAAGRAVAALARSEAAAAELARQGIAAIPGDLDAPDSLTGLPARPAVLYWFAPPPAAGTDDPRVAGLLAALDAGTLPRRLVYISTSGVYGDCGGDWVTEDRPLAPQTDRARRRAAAERRFRDWGEHHGAACAMLRVPGIYGPGRLPVERIRRGIPVLDERESPYSNRIHADDLATACFAAARRARPGAAYNVSDGHPTTMTDYFQRVADHLGLPRPPRVSLREARASFTPNMLSFLEESKRLDNRRMLGELGVGLRYPDLASGLPACLAPD